MTRASAFESTTPTEAVNGNLIQAAAPKPIAMEW